MVFFSAVVDIAIIAFVFTCVSKVLQRKVLGNDVMNKQAQMKEKQKRIKELLKKDDKESKKELGEVQTEMLEDLNVITKKQLRYMIITFPIFIVPFIWVRQEYEQVPVSVFGFELGWLWYYILMAIVSMMVITVIAKALKLENKI